MEVVRVWTKFSPMDTWETSVSANPSTFVETNNCPFVAGAGKSVFWYVYFVIYFLGAYAVVQFYDH